MSNQLTLDANLTFNVNVVKAKGLKPYFERKDLNVPLFKKAHVVMAATLEKMCELIVSEAVKHVTKDTSGLHTVNRPVLRSSVMLNKELDQYFHMTLRNFDSEQMYESQVPVTAKDLDTFLSKKFGTKVHLTPKARNLLCYLMMQTFLDVTRVSHELLTFSEKKTMERQCVKSSLQLLLKDTMVCKRIVDEVNRAWDAVVDVKDEDETREETNEADENESEVDPDSEQDDEDDKVVTKKVEKKGDKKVEKKGDKKVEKKGDKKVEKKNDKTEKNASKTKTQQKAETVDESSDEGDEGDEDDEGDEGDEGDEVDEGDEEVEEKEVVAKPTKKASNNKNRNKNKGKGKNNKNKGKGKSA